MEATYTSELIKNLAAFYQDSGIKCVHYEHIKTIRLILPHGISLKEFAKNLFNDLEKLPEINHPRQMVYFWICQVGTANFYKELINPTRQAEIDWKKIGTGPDTWVQREDLGKY